MNIPPRVKIFVWKACKGILATRQNLSRRLETITEGCLRCGSSIESDKHALFECHEALEVWRALDHLPVPDHRSFNSFRDWFAAVLKMENQQDSHFIAVVCWLIWKSRNELIFEGSCRGVGKIISYGSNLLQQYQNLHNSKEASVSYQNPSGFDSKWKPPSEGILKLNTDAAFVENRAGIGVTVRNHKGELEAMVLDYIPFCSNAEQAEALAILKALAFAKEVGITHMDLEGDALAVLNKIKSAQTDLSFIGRITGEIKKYFQTFSSSKFLLCKQKEQQGCA